MPSIKTIKNTFFTTMCFVFIFLTVLVYQQQKEISYLKSNLVVEKISRNIMSIMKVDNQKREYSFGCNTLIKDHFGKNIKWEFSTKGLEFLIDNRKITFTNSKHGIGKTWFPTGPRMGGPGSSVSTTTDKYTLSLISSNVVNEANRYFQDLIDECANQIQ